MEMGAMAPVISLDQSTVVPVGMAPFPGTGDVTAGAAPLCLETAHEDYDSVLEMHAVKAEQFYTMDEGAGHDMDMEYIYDTSYPGREMVTPEEEERRKLRRERNKVAASKCRQKRKQHVRNLVQVSEALEVQNSTLQTQITKLHDEIKQLEFMLDSHSCSRHSGGNHSNNDELALPLSH